MQVKALLILEPQPAPGLPGAAGQQDILGIPVAQRCIDRLRAGGVTEVHLVTAASGEYTNANLVRAAESELWRAAEEAFESISERNHAVVILMRASCYAEIDWSIVAQQHTERRNRVTRVCTGDGQALDIYMVDAGRRNEAAYLLRRNFRESKTPCTPVPVDGAYVKDVRSAVDLRALASDALYGRCQLPIEAQQIRPGIWRAAGAYVARSARLVAPVYIGRASRIHAGAVITRGSAIERNAAVDLGTVVENTTVLPGCQVGPCLELSHSIVSASQVFNLRRDAAVAVTDPRLLRGRGQTVAGRLAKSFAALMTFLPLQAWRGVRAATPQPPAVPALAEECAKDFGADFNPVENKPAGLIAGLAMIRRYGNQ